MGYFGRKLNTQDRDVYITSDLHFYHKGILNFCKDTRPWRDVVGMTEGLIAEWNTKVSEKDLIFHLGDFSFKGVEATENLLARLNGDKIFVLGNHDKVLRSSISSSKFGIKGIVDYLELRIDGVKVCMSHYPMTTWNQAGRGSLQFYGHCHNSLLQPRGRQCDVGYDSWGKIINIKQVMKFCLERDIYTPDHHKIIEVNYETKSR